MPKRCVFCRHWQQSSAFKNYDGGLPGKCNAPIPLWVTKAHGYKSTDRIMASNGDARECGAFAAILEETT